MQNQEYTKLLTENLNRLWSSLIINELVKIDIKNFYISPGMRNAPLIAASAYNKSINLHNVINEKVASFRALGNTIESGKPSVLICTSGTAMAHYYPAVIEAYKSKNPMIIISCDRPIELVKSGANQSIEQFPFFRPYVVDDLNLGTPNIEISPEKLQSIINNICQQSILNKGPVHVNIAFREPLDNTTASICNNYLKTAFLQSSKKVDLKITTINKITIKDKEQILQKMQKANRPLFVIGNLPVNIDKKPINDMLKIIQEKNIPFYIDITGQLSTNYNLNLGLIPSFDHMQMNQYFKDYNPDLIIHLGGRLTSKNYYSLIKTTNNLIQINNDTKRQNPSGINYCHIYCDITNWLEQFIASMDNLKIYNKFNYNFDFIKYKQNIIEDSPLCYPLISKRLMEIINDNSHLYLGNSTVIRSFDYYSSFDTQKNLKIISHRGASGIEGFISSACGYAESSNERLTLILGDLALLHDMGGLNILNEIKSPICIIVVNNNGGGIFSLLPVLNEEKLHKHLLAKHSHNFRHLSAQFNIEYHPVYKIESFEKVYNDWQNNVENSILIEAIIDNNKNIQCYSKLKTLNL